MDRLDRATREPGAAMRARPARRRSLPFAAATTLVAAFVLPSAPASSAEAERAEGRGGGAVTAAATVPVSIGDDFFSPEAVSIAAGDTVLWTNDGDDDHTATASAFHSGTLGPGDTFQRTFNTAGTYDYVCAFHDGMTGTVTVTGGTTPPPPTVRLASFGPTPFRLAGSGRLRAVYQVGQASKVAARVVSVATGRAVYAYANRSTTDAGRLTYYWAGKNAQRRDVRPGRYKFVTTVTDRQDRRVTSRKEFRVVR
jgi:plastocyanin